MQHRIHSPRSVNLCSVLLLSIIFMVGCGRSAPTIETLSNLDVSSIEESADVEFDLGDWPCWRGLNQDGKAVDVTVPFDVEDEQNLRWKISTPGRGHASPIVVGDRVLIATADQRNQTMSLLCYATSDGKELWNTELHRGSWMKSHPKNSYASATPTSDGKSVYTAFMSHAAIQVSAVDLEGEIQWQTEAGPFSSRHGYGSSPVIYKSLVIVIGDNQGSSFLTAIDRESGELVWRINRPNDSSFCSPVVANIGGQVQLLVSGHKQLVSYQPASGKQNWTAPAPAKTIANTVAWNDHLVFTSGGYPEHGLMAVKSDGSGTIVWQKKFKAYVPSPTLVGNKLLVTQDTGILHCLDAATGNPIWKQCLDGECSSSPIAVGDTMIQGTESGTIYCYMFETGFESICETELDGPIMATPVACGAGLFIRTSKSLYCFAKPE